MGPLKTSVALTLAVLHCVAGLAGEPKIIGRYNATTYQPAVSPDGKMLVIGSSNSKEVIERAIKDPGAELIAGELSAFDIASGKQVFSITSVMGEQPGLRGGPLYTAFSPDGKWLAVTGTGSSLEETTVRGNVVVFDGKSGKLHRQLNGHRAQVRSVAFSPDSTTIATASHTLRMVDDGLERFGEVRFWDTETGDLQKVWNLDDSPCEIVYSPDGKSLAFGYVGSAAEVRDADSGEVVHKKDGYFNDTSNSIAFSRDGNFFAEAGPTEDQDAGTSIRIWRTSTWKEFSRFGARQETPRATEFLRDEDVLITFGKNGTVVLWDAKTGEAHSKRALETPHEKQPFVAWFFNRGERVVVSSYGGETTHLWDLSEFVRAASSSGQTR